jgi:fumarylacetoacetate (FAA) hydrolase
VVLGDTPIGTTAAEAGACVRLVMLANDCTLRNLVPDELAKSFGFFQSKPATAFSPVAVTLDELGPAWRNGRLHLPLIVTWNGEQVGSPNAGDDMTFGFGQLIAHIAKTRNVRAGSIIGSGTVSNVDRSRGYACIAEKRCLEMIESGAATTPFLRFGDRVRIEMFDASGASIFGAIDQELAPLPRR